ncbi:MAG TPA: hypothetical protein VES39_09350 [Rhodospirillales bacterium]|jgi:hypothetical protein|nr:hypothetical protein [Rhodospirillales bacterium]
MDDADSNRADRTAAGSARSERRRRLAAALRENLNRRKAQTRVREADAAPAGADAASAKTGEDRTAADGDPSRRDR